MPIELQAAPAPTAPASDATGGRRLFSSGAPGVRDRMAFTEQLALLLETGMPLHGALQVLKQQADSPAMRSLIDDLMVEVTAGQRFSYALGKHPEVFSTTYVNLVAASEGGGFMYQVLDQLLSEDKKREQLRGTLMSALSYPGFLTVFSIAVVVFVLVVVFPKFGDMFMRIKDQLPATTIGLMWLSDALRAHWWQLLIGLAGGGALAWRWLQSDNGAATVDRLKLRLPVLRDVFVQLYITQSLRVMSLSLSHGVSIVDTLEAARDVVSNRLFRTLLVSVERSVQEGGTISAAFIESEFVPDLVKQMITTAETSGNLAPVMGRVAEHYERALERKLVTLSKMAEPVMLLVMGVLVGIIVSSLILPIFKLSKAVT